MSEMKRVELTTVSSSQKQKKVKWKQSTYRFVVTLGESNSETCPEYSFTDLVKQDKPLNGTPFDEPDEDKEVAAIAQRFEAKYGPKGLISGKRKRTQEMDDYYDPGEGYDEDDPFIDNTEAHDEVVPAIMTTQHGGFYINQGKLDFKYLDEESSDAFVITQEVKKTKKKRVLDSESEEETGAAIAKKFKAMKAMKRKKQSEGKGEKRKRQPGLEDRENIFKKKKLKNLDKLKLQKSALDSVTQKEAGNLSAPSFNISTPSLTPESLSATVTPTNKSIAPSLANHIVDEVQAMSDPVQEVVDAVQQDAMKDDSSSKSGDDAKGDNQAAEKNTLLPGQLPAELLDLIENIKREAKESKDKKLRFFSEGVNKLLLDIDLSSRNLPWGSRTAIYSHLGEHLPCGKFALQRRAKKLRESQQVGQLQLPIQKLKEAVMKVMPGLEEQHELDVQRAKNESELKEDAADVKEEASTESDEEEKTDNKKKPRCPRRKFQWSSEIRDLLLDIVSTKMKLFSSCKSRNQTAEEYLKAFLDSEIKPIWPQGWIQTRMLFKESKKAHEDLTKGTLQLAKPRKAAATNDVPSLQVENTPMHMSKTEDVIEISSNVESDDEKNISDVNSSVSKVPILGQGMSVSASTSATLSSPSIGQVTNQSFKAPMSSTPVTHLSSSGSTALTQKSVDTSPITSVKRVVPIPVPGSKNIAAKSLAPAFSSAVAPSSGPPGSATQQQSNSHPASPQQKAATLQQTTNSQQHKHPQELPKAANQQQNKAAMRSSPVLGSMHNSTWAHVNSVVPATKPVNPFVAVHRIPETSTQKHSLGGKSSSSTLQQNQTVMFPAQQQEKTLNNASAGLKPNQAVRKPQQLETNNSSCASSSDIPQVKKPVNMSQNSMSSGPDSQTKTTVHHSDGPQKNSNPQHSKSGIVGSTSCVPVRNTSSNSGQKLSQQNQHIKPTVGVGSSSSQPNSSGNADSPNRTAQSQGNIRQHSPPAKLLGSSDRLASQVSPPIVLLDISSSPSMSRSNSPSPQKSPVSPQGNAALSLYEQIKSQIWHQEAMEDQALKNLALALNCGGSDASRLYGNGGDAGSQSGKR